MIIKIMKNNDKLNENNELVMYDLTTVNCTYNYTHSGKMSKLCNMYNNNVCGPHQHQKLCLLCHATHGVTRTSMLAYHLVWYRVCYLPPTRQITNIDHW